MKKQNIILLVVGIISLAIAITISVYNSPRLQMMTGKTASSGSSGVDYNGGMMTGDFAVGAPEITLGNSMMARDAYYPSPMPVPGGQLDAGKYVIKNGSLSLTVLDANKATTSIETIARSHGGETLTRSLSADTQNLLSGYVTVQVRAADFDVAMSEIKAVATQVISENVSTDDVTSQVVDLDARLKNARAEEAAYLAILTQAKDVQDILAVQQYLSQVRQTIEQLDAQRKSLEGQTTYSTITAYLSEDISIEVGGQAFRPLQTAIDALQTVIDGVKAFALILIQAIIIGGAIILPLLLIYGIYRVIKRS